MPSPLPTTITAAEDDQKTCAKAQFQKLLLAPQTAKHRPTQPLVANNFLDLVPGARANKRPGIGLSPASRKRVRKAGPDIQSVIAASIAVIADDQEEAAHLTEEYSKRRSSLPITTEPTLNQPPSVFNDNNDANENSDVFFRCYRDQVDQDQHQCSNASSQSQSTYHDAEEHVFNKPSVSPSKPSKSTSTKLRSNKGPLDSTKAFKSENVPPANTSFPPSSATPMKKPLRRQKRRKLRTQEQA